MTEPDTPPPQRQLLLVTGLAGAGKSTALAVLEDLGWETIDNFPVRMLKRLVTMPDEARGPLAIGFDSRTRGFVPGDIIALVKDLAERPDLALTSLFLDCAGGELERRFNETRRRHPMAAALLAAATLAHLTIDDWLTAFVLACVVWPVVALLVFLLDRTTFNLLVGFALKPLRLIGNRRTE